MTKNNIVSARLDMIVSKAIILSEQYKNNQLWDGDLARALDEIEREIAAVRKSERATTSSGWQGDR